jgi:molybdate transport system permease protein
VALVALPLIGLAARSPWGRIGDLGSPLALDALRISLVVSVGAAAIAVLLGVPVAWLLATREFPFRTLVRALVVLPLVLPPVVGGVALLAAFGRRGLLGGLLEAVGVELAFTRAGAVVAAAFVSFPLLVLAAEGGFRSTDIRLEQAAAGLGASPWYRFARVVLPLAAPQVAVGAVLAWARALGEFGATIMFAGNLAGRTQTLPLAVFELQQTDPRGAALLSMLLVAVSLAVLLALRGRFLRPA